MPPKKVMARIVALPSDASKPFLYVRQAEATVAGEFGVWLSGDLFILMQGFGDEGLGV